LKDHLFVLKYVKTAVPNLLKLKDMRKFELSGESLDFSFSRTSMLRTAVFELQEGHQITINKHPCLFVVENDDDAARLKRM
jgi:hypothetical protein